MATTETAEAAAAATTAAAATEPEIKFSPKAFRYFTPAKYASMLDRRGRRRSPRSCAANFTPNGGKFLATNFCVRLRRSSTSQDTRRARCEWECLRACVCEESAKGQAPSPIGVPMCVCVWQSANLLPREAYLWQCAAFCVASTSAATCRKVVEAWAAQLPLQRE